MNYKSTDGFNRIIKKNIYIIKIKEVQSFIHLINNIYKSIMGKNEIKEFFYKFDRVLSVKLNKIEPKKFNFNIHLENINTNYQVYIEDLYSLLYLFFIGIKVTDTTIVKKDNSYNIDLLIEFNVEQSQQLLMKDVILRIKHIKNKRRKKTNG